jgi:hypothetical protein
MIDHGPKCIACTNPAEARRGIAAERAALDEQAALAARHRAAGEAAREENRRADVDSPEFAETQARMIRELGTANAILQGVRMYRAHLDRVEAAHPAVRKSATTLKDAT